MQLADSAQAQTIPASANATFLDGLLEDGKAEQQLQAPEAQGLDDFLNDLLGESMAEQAARTRLKEARKQVKNTALPGSKTQALREEIRELEYVAEWTAVADVIWIKRCICEQCGGETPQFAGYFRKAHSRLSKAYRWTSLSAEVESALPREIKEEMTSTPMCADCLPTILMEDGWLNAEPVDEEFGLVEALLTETAVAVATEDTPQDDYEVAEDAELQLEMEEELEHGTSS